MDDRLIDDPMGMRDPLNDLTSDEALNVLLRIQQSLICSICHDIMFSPFTTECGHSYCYDCLYQWLKKDSGHRTCPNCRKRIRSKPVLNLGIKQVGDILIKTIDVRDPVKGKSLADQREVSEKELQHDLQYSKEVFPLLFDNASHGRRGGAGAATGFIDGEDGVRRCTRCLWEVPGREVECPNCGLWIEAVDEEDEPVIGDLDSDNAIYSDDGGRFRTPLFANSEEEGEDALTGDEHVEEIDDYDEELDGGFIDDRDTSDIIREDGGEIDDDSDSSLDDGHGHFDSFDLDLGSDMDMDMVAGEENSVIGRGGGSRGHILGNGRSNTRTVTTTTTTTHSSTPGSNPTTNSRTVRTVTNGDQPPVVTISSDDSGEEIASGPSAIRRRRVQRYNDLIQHHSRSQVISDDEEDGENEDNSAATSSTTMTRRATNSRRRRLFDSSEDENSNSGNDWVDTSGNSNEEIHNLTANTSSRRRRRTQASTRSGQRPIVLIDDSD